MTQPTRKVVGNIALSIDGRINGRGGDNDMSWIVPHAVTETARDHLTKMTRTATTALMGRKNYEGFGQYWPAVANDDTAEPRDRAFAQWLNTVDKVVFTTTLNAAPWPNSRISRDPVTEDNDLRTQPGGDIIVLSSTSIIRALLAANELDRLIINLCPEIGGGGARLFDGELEQSTWSLTDQSTSTTGATFCTYDRQR